MKCANVGAKGITAGMRNWDWKAEKTDFLAFPCCVASEEIHPHLHCQTGTGVHHGLFSSSFPLLPYALKPELIIITTAAASKYIRKW